MLSGEQCEKDFRFLYLLTCDFVLFSLLVILWQNCNQNTKDASFIRHILLLLCLERISSIPLKAVGTYDT